jgi:hypothetical protein
LGGLRRGLPLSPPSVVGFPPRRADFPRMIWKVVPSSYRFLLCLAGSLGSGRRHRGAALLGVWLLRPPFCLRPGFSVVLRDPPSTGNANVRGTTKRGGASRTRPLRLSSFAARSPAKVAPIRFALRSLFSLGMLKTSETSGGAGAPPSLPGRRPLGQYVSYPLPFFQAFRCLAAPGDSLHPVIRRTR